MDLDSLERKVHRRANVRRVNQRWPRALHVIAERKAKKDGWDSLSQATRALVWAWVRGDIAVKVDNSA